MAYKTDVKFKLEFSIKNIFSLREDGFARCRIKIRDFSDYDGIGTHLTSETGNLPYFDTTDVTQLGFTVLQALQRFTRFVNKNSVIGKRISSYVSVHYGADVANSLFNDSNHIGSFTYPLSVIDVL